MDVLGQVERLRAELSARLEVDVAGLVAGLRARLESRLALTPLLLDADLADHRGRLSLGRMRTWAFESPALRKIVLSEVSLRPLYEGLHLALLPRADVRAPAFIAELRLLPTWITAHADLYGPVDQTRGILAPLAPAFAAVGSDAAPAWAARIASGDGLHARASARRVDDLSAAVSGALGRYLDFLDGAPRGGDATKGQQELFALFHAHGPRRGPLSSLFGSAWAERFSRVAYE